MILGLGSPFNRNSAVRLQGLSLGPRSTVCVWALPLGPCLLKVVGSSGDCEQAEAGFSKDKCAWATWREVEPVGAICTCLLGGQRALEMALGPRGLEMGIMTKDSGREAFKKGAIRAFDSLVEGVGCGEAQVVTEENAFRFLD